MISHKYLGIFASLLVLTSTSVQAATNLLIIVDGSNSMWGQIDSVAKIETAKKTLRSLVSDFPADTKVGLMAYGHSAEGDCKNVEVLSAIDSESKEALTKRIDAIQPKGKTPIAYALSQSIAVFNGFEGQNNHILLVSDGIESCNGDPCAVATQLSDAGLNVRAHVVGFGLSDSEGDQLKCIAKNTGGNYFDASDTTGFDTAIKQVAELTQTEPEPKPEPVSELYFEDNFDGDDLSDSWSILNPNPEQYIVENGSLFLIATDKGGLSDKENPNIIKLLKEMPSGDWTITIEMTPDLQTNDESFSFGLYTDNENYLVTQIYTTDGYFEYSVNLKVLKTSRGKKTFFENIAREIADTRKGPFVEYIKKVGANKKITAKLIKQGRKYKSMLHYEGTVDKNGKPIWVETKLVSSLRAPKHFVINAGQIEKNDGETLFNIDSIKIETN